MMMRAVKAVLITGLLLPLGACAAWQKEPPPPVSAPVDPYAAVRPATASVGVTMPDANDFQHSWDISTYVLRVTQFGHMAPLNGGVAFVGDSLTDWARWNEMFPDQRVRNFGIAGDTTVGLQHRLSQVIDARPAKIFLMIGTNDVEFSRIPPDGIVANIVAMVARLQAGVPGVKIYVESLLPREPKWDAKVRTVNALLGPAVEKSGAAYIDLYPAFVKDGRLDPHLTPDDIHLSGDGYVRWRNILRPFIGNN
jgi:lysophospholipase L1-like esterase